MLYIFFGKLSILNLLSYITNLVLISCNNVVLDIMFIIFEKNISCLIFIH
jgi:hypothetical protein